MLNYRIEVTDNNRMQIHWMAIAEINKSTINSVKYGVLTITERSFNKNQWVILEQNL